MPQNGAYENHNLWMKTGKGASHSCYRGVSDLIQLTTGQASELRNVVGLVALPFCSEPTPTPGGNHISDTVHWSPAQASWPCVRGPRFPNSRFTWDRSVV